MEAETKKCKEPGPEQLEDTPGNLRELSGSLGYGEGQQKKGRILDDDDGKPFITVNC